MKLLVFFLFLCTNFCFAIQTNEESFNETYSRSSNSISSLGGSDSSSDEGLTPLCSQLERDKNPGILVSPTTPSKQSLCAYKKPRSPNAKGGFMSLVASSLGILSDNMHAVAFS